MQRQINRFVWFGSMSNSQIVYLGLKLILFFVKISAVVVCLSAWLEDVALQLLYSDFIKLFTIILAVTIMFRIQCWIVHLTTGKSQLAFRLVQIQCRILTHTTEVKHGREIQLESCRQQIQFIFLVLCTAQTSSWFSRGRVKLILMSACISE